MKKAFITVADVMFMLTGVSTGRASSLTLATPSSG